MNNSKGKSVLSASSKEFLAVQSEFEMQIHSFNKKLDELEMKNNKEKNKITLKLMENRTNFNLIEKDIKDLKELLNEHVQEQRQYYLDILKMGIDVR